MLESAGWSRMKVSNFSDLVGPVWQRGAEPHFAFIVDTKHGELVELRCEIVTATRSLIFMRGICHVGDSVIATCDGIWKVPNQGG